MRVLAIWPLEDTVWVIGLPRQHPNKASRTSSYMLGPQRRSLSTLGRMKDEHQIVASEFAGRALLDMQDDKILASAPHDRARKHRQKMIDDRDGRWEALLPVLCGAGTKPRSFDELICDANLPAAIKQRAAELGKAPSTLYALLHQFWALGGRKNSVCTNLWKCGCPGQPKKQSSKLGRRSRLFTKNEVSEGFVLREEDKRKLGYGYRLINHRVSAHDAFILCSGTFWADRTVEVEAKKIRSTLGLYRPVILCGGLRRWSLLNLHLGLGGSWRGRRLARSLQGVGFGF